MITPQATAPEEWMQLLNEAKTKTGTSFCEHAEHYIITTLHHHTRKTTLADGCIGIDLLTFQQEHQLHHLRALGDRCLLISGLFPEYIIKRNVSYRYFISIGEAAYAQLVSDHNDTYDPELFQYLSFHFTGLVDLLYAIRHH